MVISMRKTLVSLALSASLLASCTINFGSEQKPREHTTSEKTWLAGMIACNAADYYTTKEFLSKGMKEANPIYGENPSDEKLIVGKLAGVIIFYIAGQVDPDNRELYYKIGSGLACGAAAWNKIQMNKQEN